MSSSSHDGLLYWHTSDVQQDSWCKQLLQVNNWIQHQQRLALRETESGLWNSFGTRQVDRRTKDANGNDSHTSDSHSFCSVTKLLSVILCHWMVLVNQSTYFSKATDLQYNEIIVRFKPSTPGFTDSCLHRWTICYLRKMCWPVLWYICIQVSLETETESESTVLFCLFLYFCVFFFFIDTNFVVVEYLFN